MNASAAIFPPSLLPEAHNVHPTWLYEYLAPRDEIFASARGGDAGGEVDSIWV